MRRRRAKSNGDVPIAGPERPMLARMAVAPTYGPVEPGKRTKSALAMVKQDESQWPD